VRAKSSYEAALDVAHAEGAIKAMRALRAQVNDAASIAAAVAAIDHMLKGAEAQLPRLEQAWTEAALAEDRAEGIV
jgi:hypothetical protein